MLKDFKFDMPAVLALLILGLFAIVCIFSMVKTGTLEADFKQTLFAITMVAVGFYLGSSSDSRKKTEMMATTPPAPPVSTTTTVTDASTVTRTEPTAAPAAPAA